MVQKIRPVSTTFLVKFYTEHGAQYFAHFCQMLFSLKASKTICPKDTLIVGKMTFIEGSIEKLNKNVFVFLTEKIYNFVRLFSNTLCNILTC
jgi:hypothetical protein